MKTLELRRDKIDEKSFLRMPVKASDYPHTVSAPIRIISGQETLCVVEEVSESTDDLLAACKGIRRYDVGSRSSGLKTTSKVFGFAPRTPTRNHHDYCSLTSLAHEQPRTHHTYVRWAEIVQSYYARHAPEIFEMHHKMASSHVLPEWRIPGSVFTSGIVNKNNPLAYHKDRGNFHNCWSAMVVLKKHCEGGDLSLPELGVTLKLPDRSLLLFNGQRLWHGVTPFRLLEPTGYRYSVVWYTLEQMKACLPPTDEVKRAQRVRTERELRKAGVIK